MSEMKEVGADDPNNPALNEFVENVAKVNDGLSEMISCASRMQMLIMEDAKNMMAEFEEIRRTAGMRGAEKDGI